jgi:trk system potassium uptake protein TrkH
MNHARRPRVNLKLRDQYQAILGYLGLTLGLVGAVMLTPIAAVFFWPREWPYVFPFVLPGTILLGGGWYAYRRFRPRETVLTMQDGGLIIVGSWFGACLFGAGPLMWVEGLTITQAAFESVSGWTTTGLSVVDVTKAAHITLIWRSVMQLVGGAGFAIIMVAALTGLIGVGLPTAEGRNEQLAPHIRQSAKLVLFMYSAYATVGVFAYRLAGMSWFGAGSTRSTTPSPLFRLAVSPRVRKASGIGTRWPWKRSRSC